MLELELEKGHSILHSPWGFSGLKYAKKCNLGKMQCLPQNRQDSKGFLNMCSEEKICQKTLILAFEIILQILII